MSPVVDGKLIFGVKSLNIQGHPQLKPELLPLEPLHPQTLAKKRKAKNLFSRPMQLPAEHCSGEVDGEDDQQLNRDQAEDHRDEGQLQPSQEEHHHQDGIERNVDQHEAEDGRPVEAVDVGQPAKGDDVVRGEDAEEGVDAAEKVRC